MHKVYLNNTWIHYEVEGCGLPCFVIGFGSYQKKLLSGKLKNYFRFIYTDFRGLNARADDFDVNTLTLANILLDIDELRKYLGVERIAVFGHSSSGTVALDYAINYKEHVSYLLLICAPPVYNRSFRNYQKDFMDKHLPKERRKMLEQNIKKYNAMKDNLTNDEKFIAFHAVQAPLYWFDLNNDGSEFWEGININSNVINQFVPNVYNDSDPPKVLSEIKAPVFLALGRHDFAAPYPIWDKYLEEFVNIKCKLYEKSSHYPMIEERDVFDDDLINWMEKLIV